MSTVLFLASLTLGGLYLVGFCWRQPSMAKSFVKTSGVLGLALFAGHAGLPAALIAGLAFSAAGDLLLSRGERYLLPGIGAFALAHIAYIAVFIGELTTISDIRVFPALALVGLAASTEVWLIPRTEDLRWAVRGYVALIAAMGILALGVPVALAGLTAAAILFVASDLVLSLELFVLGEGHPTNRVTAPVVWALYFSAQVLFATFGWSQIG